MLLVHNDNQVQPFIDYNNFEIEKEKNGIFSISLDVLNTKKNKQAYDLIQEEALIEHDGHEFRIKMLDESRFRKSFTAIHTFFDLKGVPIEETKGGTITIDEAFSFLLKGTGWTFEIKGDFEHELVPNFGNDKVLALIWVACDAFQADIDIKPNKHLVVGNNLGKDDDFQFRYRYNIKALKRNVDATDFGTRIVGRGADGLKVEYISPLEEQYKKNNPDFVPIYAEEVKDDRIKHEDTMLKKLKRTLQDVPEINLEVETAVLGEDRDVHDNVWLIYEPLGIELHTQIIKKTEYPKAPHKNKVEFGNKKQSFTDLMTEQNIKIDQNNKEVHSRIDQTNDRITLEVEELDESIAAVEIEQRKITLRVENFEKETRAQFEVMDDEISARVTSAEAESIFEQKAKSFTFTADQINFNGQVFGDSNATFEGKVRAERLIGNEISGITLRTSNAEKYIHLQDQNLYFYEGYGSGTKMHIGYRNEFGNPTQIPFIIMGKGQTNGRDKIIFEKDSRYFQMRYSAEDGDSELLFNYDGGGSGALRIAGNRSTLYFSAGYAVQSSTQMRAPEFNQTSTVKAKSNISEWDGVASDVINDTHVYQFHFQNDIDKGEFNNPQIGFLAEAAPALKTNDAISLNRAVGYLWKGYQEKDVELQKVKKELEDIKTVLEVMI